MVWADDPVLPSGGSLTAFHGTDIESAHTLLQGEPLNVEKAAAHKIDGPPGFFLATEVDDAIVLCAQAGTRRCIGIPPVAARSRAAPGGWNATPADSTWQDYPVHW